MSPQQARGLPVDARADVWAFGCVLFEMLSGSKAFEGGTLEETIASIVEREPPLNALPAGTPRRVADVIGRCLVKDQGRRLTNIADARLEIDEARTARTPDRLSRRTLGALAAVAILTVALLWYPWQRPTTRTAAGDSGWVQITNIDSAAQPAISRDGKELAFIRGPATLTSVGRDLCQGAPRRRAGAAHLRRASQDGPGVFT